MAFTLKKAILGGGLFLGGVVATLVTLYVVADKRSREDVHRDYVIDYTKKEQTERGVACLGLRQELLALLNVIDDSVIAPRRMAEDWSVRVTDGLKADLEKYRTFILTCRHLYAAGDNGKVNGLTSVGFVEDISNDYAVMNSLLRLGPPRMKCDSKCVDTLFLELRGHRDAIERKLKL
jgi:hypothetical protein